MKIHYLQYRDGFRSLKHIAWKPGDLNVVIGQNASGKSNLTSGPAQTDFRLGAKGNLREYVICRGAA